MKDVCGNEVCVGDTVAMAKRSGNSTEMVIRKVVEISEEKNRWSIKVEAPSGRSGWTSPSVQTVG